MGERIADFEDSPGRPVTVIVSEEFSLVKIQTEHNDLVMDQYEFEKLAKFVMGIK